MMMKISNNNKAATYTLTTTAAGLACMLMLAKPSLSSAQEEQQEQVTPFIPFDLENCGLVQTIEDVPQRAVTMNQGATEVMLALGLEGSMVGHAWLDDEIWPE